jgi:hypothetical protein
MKNTPLQKHVDFLNEIVEGIVDRNIKIAFEIIRNRATQLLEEEKQMVVDAHYEGFRTGSHKDGEQYFNETFEQ